MGRKKCSETNLFVPEREYFHKLVSGYIKKGSCFSVSSDLETDNKLHPSKSYGIQRAQIQNRSVLMNLFHDKIEQRIPFAVRCLQEYGFCVINNVCGEPFCSQVLCEVKSLHTSGLLQDGQVTDNNSNVHPPASKKVRQDIITWIGDEHSNPAIRTWTKNIDKFVKRVSAYFPWYCIEKRTKAMVACYPGSEGAGRSFVKHIDNPNRDGRVLTCLYYLNKDWNSAVNGGVLRLYPKRQPMQVATVDPTFDRLLVFWSDHRNPHEVTPSFATRYAITMWYMDSHELEATEQHTSEEAGSSSYVQLQ